MNYSMGKECVLVIVTEGGTCTIAFFAGKRLFPYENMPRITSHVAFMIPTKIEIHQ